jgi:RimJ/RimL family protein N-acetyltransferase
VSARPAGVCPVLTTARLTLGPHRLEDFEDSLALWTNSDVVRFIGGTPSPPQEVWQRQLRYAGLWPLVGYGYWQVRETGTGRFVGEVGFAEFRREITPSLVGYPEAGWVLAPWAHGMGLAREATEAIFAWADEFLDAGRTVCMIAPENAPSLALAGKLGFKPFAEALYRNEPTVLLERWRPSQ